MTHGLNGTRIRKLIIRFYLFLESINENILYAFHFDDRDIFLFVYLLLLTDVFILLLQLQLKFI